MSTAKKKTKEIILPCIFGRFRIQAQAIVLYPFVFYKSQEAKDKYGAHEMIHVEQVQRLGWFKFYASYLWESYKVGYWENKYEIEARERSGV